MQWLRSSPSRQSQNIAAIKSAPVTPFVLIPLDHNCPRNTKDLLDEILASLPFTKFCWVGQHINNTTYETGELPNPRPTQLKEKLYCRWHFGISGHFFLQQMIFRGLGSISYRKQTTRNPTQPNSPQTPYLGTECLSLSLNIRNVLLILTCKRS